MSFVRKRGLSACESVISTSCQMSNVPFDEGGFLVVIKRREERCHCGEIIAALNPVRQDMGGRSSC